MKNSSTANTFENWPYSVRLCFKLLLLILIAIIIVLCKPVIVPLYFSVLLSILLLPFVNLLERIKLPSSLAALLAVLSALLVVSMFIYLLSSQILSFLNDVNAIKKHLSEHYETLQNWVNVHLNISQKQQDKIVDDATLDMQESKITYIKQTFFTVTEVFIFSIFTFIYSFLILFYRQTIRRFLFAIFKREHQENLIAVLTGTKQVIKGYMSGLFMEMLIISILNMILLFIIGVKYAVSLAIIVAVLNIIPFIGIYVGIIFTVLVTLTTTAGTGQIVWICVGLLIIHFIDANFILPKIVGSKVKVNALITIVGVVSGGFLLGISGVFFALPTIAILKIIFDRIEPMKPWAILLGDESDRGSKKIVERINRRLTRRKIEQSSVKV